MKKLNSTTLKEVGVSHNSEIKKRIMIKSGEYSNIQMFSRAIFYPKQSSLPHTHQDMTEVFFILSGRGIFHSKDKEILVKKDDYISIPSGEEHWQSNPFNEPLELLYFGIRE